MLIGLNENKKVDIYEDSDIKTFLNMNYKKHLFPVGTDASIFTCLEPCEALKEFKKAAISFKVALYDINRNVISTTKKEFFAGGEKRTTVEFTNVVDFIKFLHSLLELHSFNLMFENKDKYGAFMFVLQDFVMEIKYGNVKETLKLKEKHRKLFNDFMGVFTDEKSLNAFLIPTAMRAIEDLFGLGGRHKKPQLFDSMDQKIFLNEKLTKWDTKNSFGGQSLISESLINSNAVTFVNKDIDDILSCLKLVESGYNGIVKDDDYDTAIIRKSIAGSIKICQYVPMVDEDDLPYDGEPLTIERIAQLQAPSIWFDVHDILVYPLYTPADYVEAACMAYYMLKTSAFQLDLLGDDIKYKSILEINFSCYSYMERNSEVELPPDDYSITLYESDLEEAHEQDSVLKEMMASICRYLKLVHAL